MAYQTGSAAGPTQLLDASRVFAVANGWTQLRWQASGAGYELSLTKNGLYVHLRSAVSEALRSGYNQVTGIFLTASSAFDGGQPWNNQPGTVRNTSSQIEACGLYNVGASTTYHLLAAANPDMLMLVAEVSPGVFHQLGFGRLAKYGAYAGGDFITGSFGGDNNIQTNMSDWCFSYANDRHGGVPFNDFKYGGQTFVRGTVDAADRWFAVCQSSPLTGWRAFSVFGGGFSDPYTYLVRLWWDCVPNSLNGVTPMLPFYVCVQRPAGMWSPFGHTPHLRYCNLTHYAPAEQFAIGGEQWMAFPGHSKNDKSGVHGYAVRVDG